jgi:exodeoxyribonuclease V beta subunit
VAGRCGEQFFIFSIAAYLYFGLDMAMIRFKMPILNVQELPLDKKILIEASAGTGKTYTIGLIVLRLLLENLLTIEKIILVTFTKAAATELKKETSEKIIKAYDIWKNGSDEKNDLTTIIENAKKEKMQIREANLLDAIARIDELSVFTIHGFCERLLNEFAFEIGVYEEKEIIADPSHIKDRIVADFWRREVQNLDEAIGISPAELSQSINVLLNHPQAKIYGEEYELYSTEEKKMKYAIAYKLAKEAHERLQEEKRKLRIMDFNDLIENCYRAIKNDDKNILQKAVKKNYDVILVDEFQDTDKMQFEIFNYLFKDKPFFMIGDPKQAIYRFRGGDIFAYKEAKNSASKQFSMSKNYRSEGTLLDALNCFFEDNSFKQKMSEEIPCIECGKPELEPIEKKDNKYKPFVIWKGGNENFDYKVQQAVIAEIKRLLGTGKFEPKDIAILLDSNADCLDYKNALVKERIFAIVKGGSIFVSEAAVFLKILLNAICHNNNIKYLMALLTNNFCGFEPKDMDSVLIEWTSAIYETKLKWKRHGIMNAIDFFMTKQNLWGQIAANVNGERNITNIRQLMELLNEEETKFGKIPEKINRHFAELCNNLEKNEETEEKLETDEDALKIMTIHKSKGLQFNIVFVPDIGRKSRDHRFPAVYMYHLENENTIAYLAEDKNAKELNNIEENEETARLLYVALTRAKFRLYVAYRPPEKTKKNEIDKRKTSYCREIFDNFCNSNASHKIQIANLDEILGEKYEYNKIGEVENITNQPRPLPSSFSIKAAWQKTSFTRISQNLEYKDYIPVSQQTEIEIPAGKRIGTLLHSIFENLDFNANDNEIKFVVESKLGGFKEFSEKTENGKERKFWIENQVKTILNKNLSDNAGKLCEIDVCNKITELNFFMKSEKIYLKKIKEIMKEKVYDFETEELPDKYIKGAIDLVFLGKDEKYYILDWKSNNLSDFSQSGMEEAMQQHGYHLQYYIYAVALKRWLEQIHKDFNFKKQFGGAYYIFIRGVNDKNSDGIYFANSDSIADDILEMDKNFNGEY